jgi:hypothetical protein
MHKGYHVGISVQDLVQNVEKSCDEGNAKNCDEEHGEQDWLILK